ncbi:hypothetical protein FSP39_010776 [Pinctada imbricata]|uniref:Tyrosine-protein phosphatase domain-containing protein n=1 Tax=Pinctada imbricata TaxID=66713 RepID=A0AA88XRC2_PINIB|nr:hypothetical protein FSP39_010776 [Pinctada imbricata]
MVFCVCSAGIGRTGTYIAFEELLKQARKHKNVDVFEFVKSMRENRMNMIQTLTLLSIRPVTDKASKDDALSKDNKSKNRTLDVIPLIKHRPYLFSHVAKRTSYINAVMLPTLRAQVGMIATQYPTQDTVQDFWCLIHDQESPNVVILEPNKEEIQLFPNGEESELFGNIYVQQTSIDETKGANERKLSLLKKDTEEARQIDVFECLSWSWQEKLPTSSSVLLKLINRVFEWRDFKKTTDGATKCGLFCSLFNTLEYLVEHGDVDVPRSVRQLQIRRPEFMTNIDQYEMVYEAVHEYLEQSSIYANT